MQSARRRWHEPCGDVSESRRGKRSAMRWRQRKPTRVRQFMRRLQLVCPVGSGGLLLQALAEPCIHRVFALSRSVHRVRERVLQFLRFQEITGGILYGEIAPDADVLAFVMPHFADRFPLENFVILDERRAAAGIHPAGKAWFLTKLSKQELDTLQQAGQQKDENEQEIEVLFQSFCRSLSILERQNQPLQQQLVPLKYRMHMTEFQKK